MTVDVPQPDVNETSRPYWNALREVVHVTTRALEDVVEMNKYPIAEIEEMTSRNRRIGVGLMGWADLLYKLRIGYNSEEAIALAEKMMGFIDDESNRRRLAVPLAASAGVISPRKRHAGELRVYSIGEDSCHRV